MKAWSSLINGCPTSKSSLMSSYPCMLLKKSEGESILNILAMFLDNFPFLLTADGSPNQNKLREVLAANYRNPGSHTNNVSAVKLFSNQVANLSFDVVICHIHLHTINLLLVLYKCILCSDTNSVSTP